MSKTEESHEDLRVPKLWLWEYHYRESLFQSMEGWLFKQESVARGVQVLMNIEIIFIYNIDRTLHALWLVKNLCQSKHKLKHKKACFIVLRV